MGELKSHNKVFQIFLYFRMQQNQNQGHDRYQNRQYQPYVFRPNFMKNQDGEKKQYGRKVFAYYFVFMTVTDVKGY